MRWDTPNPIGHCNLWGDPQDILSCVTRAAFRAQKNIARAAQQKSDGQWRSISKGPASSKGKRQD